MWEEDADREPPPAAGHEETPARPPLTPTWKFVYFLIALAPFVAFVLLLPRGGAESAGSDSPAPVTNSPEPLAFPFSRSDARVGGPSPAGPAESVPASPECSDGVDNDSDGRTDYPADPGCRSGSDNSEASPAPRASGGPSPAPAPAPAPPPAAEPTPTATQSPPPPAPPPPPPDPEPTGPPRPCRDPIDFEVGLCPNSPPVGPDLDGGNR